MRNVEPFRAQTVNHCANVCDTNACDPVRVRWIERADYHSGRQRRRQSIAALRATGEWPGAASRKSRDPPPQQPQEWPAWLPANLLEESVRRERMRRVPKRLVVVFTERAEHAHHEPVIKRLAQQPKRRVFCQP